MADRVKEVARGEAEHIKTQTIQAARSAAYLYPLRARRPYNLPSQIWDGSITHILQGIYYFISHRDLW